MAFWPRTLLAIAVFGSGTCAWGQNELREGFEGPETSWRESGGDAHYKIEAHRRNSSLAHSGKWCEQFRISGNNGSTVYISHDIGQARILSELSLGVWLKADRPGLQIMARIVLPRSKDPKTGKPLTMLIAGGSYSRVGAWQQLTLTGTPKLVERQVRVVRAQYGSDIDVREAYIDRMVLNIYGGPGTTNVSIDDLEVLNLVDTSADSTDGSDGNAHDEGTKRLPLIDAGPRLPNQHARLSGPLLLVDGKAIFPRAIEYRGESFVRLRDLGFNTVLLNEHLTAELIDEAASVGLWIIAPPPSLREFEQAGAAINRRLATDYDPVLAWKLEPDRASNRASNDLDATKRWAKLVRAADPHQRPILGETQVDLRSYSRSVDLLLVSRAPIGSSFELTDYAPWLRQRQLLARPGTVFWTSVQTQLAPQLVQQCGDLSGGRGSALGPPTEQVQSEQVRHLVFAALSARVRGMCFESRTSLEAPDRETRYRAATLELVNLELDLIEPWAAAGSFATNADSTDPQMDAAVIQAEGSRLVVPVAKTPGGQYVLGGGGAKAASIVVPAASESSNVYELTPAGLRPLAHVRVAGGLRVTLHEGDRSSLIVLTQDPIVYGRLSRKLAKISRRAAQLERELVAHDLAEVEAVDRQLAAMNQSLPQSQTGLKAAKSALSQSDGLLAKGSSQDASWQARRAGQSLRQLQREYWEKAIQIPGGRASPLAMNFATLPDFWRTWPRNHSQQAANLLPAGSCENLDAMVAAGWQHSQRPLLGIGAAVELSGESPHSGRMSVHLQAAARTEKPPSALESAPVWITTAPVNLFAGQPVRIRGFVRIPKPLTGGHDQLMIIDSVGGEALAERIGQTRGWVEFNLLRVAPQASPLTVTFALASLGDVWLDDISFEPVNQAAGEEQARR